MDFVLVGRIVLKSFGAGGFMAGYLGKRMR